MANSVARAVPDVIVVSGDLVDHPSPSLFWQQNASSVGGPGHAEDGDRPGPNAVPETTTPPQWAGHRNWFDHIFNGADTTAAESALKEACALQRLGFHQEVVEKVLDLKPGARPQEMTFLERVKFFIRGNTNNYLDDLIASRLGPRQDAPLVLRSRRAPLLFAMLDSNPRRGGRYAAAGEVDTDKLMALRGALEDVREHYIARIAVVHHHVLPVAFAKGAERFTGELMMVLRNAGAVLRVLADPQVRSHRARPLAQGAVHADRLRRQRERELSHCRGSGWGSCARPAEENCINLIDVGQNGQISVRTISYGTGQFPDLADEVARGVRAYSEPMSAVRRRAHFPLLERHQLRLVKRTQICEITENGDLWAQHHFDSLRYTGAGCYAERRFWVGVPQVGDVVPGTLVPDEELTKIGVRVGPAADGEPGV